MHLTAILKEISRLEGIPERRFVWDEVKWFEREHKGHGTYQLEIHEDEEGKIESIAVACEPTLIDENQCCHENAPTIELSFSLIYQKKTTFERRLQKARREGRLEVIEKDGEVYLKIGKRLY